VARQLTAAGHRVRALVRDPARADALGRLGIELHRGDVTAKTSMRLPMTGVDGVFHIAGWYKVGVRDRADARSINVDGTQHVLELMEELQIKAGVYTSTLAVNSDTHGQVVDETYRFHGRHISLYDATKAEAHRVAERFIARGLPLVIVQPGLVYGPGDTSGVRTTLIQFLKRKLPALPSQTAFCWSHVDDIARGHVLAMERGQPGRNYFLAGPVHTLTSAIELASELTGIPAPRGRMHPAVLRVAASAMAMADRIVRVPPAYTSEGLRVIAGVTYLGSGERAKRELGWMPRPLREGLAETLEHERSQMYAG
jgi:nucleoside-diphosphate-sugar epimerase